MLLLLFRTRFVPVDELAAEIQDRTVRPVVGHLERRGDGNHEFVLVFEPDTLAVGVFVAFVIFLGRFDLHAVVAELGIELGFEREEVLREEVAQPENRRQGNLLWKHIRTGEERCQLGHCKDELVLTWRQ